MHPVEAAAVDPVPPGAIAAGSMVAPPADATAAGLRVDQLEALQAAHHDRRRIRRAAGVAALSGWTLAVFAGLTLLTGIFSVPAFLLGVGMAVTARTELRGSKALRLLDLSAPRRLGVNQLALGAMLCLYASWGIVAALTGPSRYAEQMAAGGQVAEMLEPIDSLHRVVTVIVYVGVILIGLAACGCTSLYYFTRRRHIEAHLRATPAWIVEAMRNLD